jgi:hypothetical protein
MEQVGRRDIDHKTRGARVSEREANESKPSELTATRWQQNGANRAAPIAIGLITRKGKLSPATEKFCQCAKEAVGG